MRNSVYDPKITFVIALVLFVVDAFVLNQGLIAIVCLLTIFLYRLPKSISLKLKKRSPKTQLTKSLIYGVMALCVFGANSMNNKMAKGRAEQLISVIEHYYLDNGKYPRDFENLVPEYLSKVPIAKYTLSYNKFRYIRHGNDAMLFYVSFPPFGRPVYKFRDKKWLVRG